MLRFRNLAVASLVMTFILVAIGGLVRATESGLGCGDNWPNCPGDLTRAQAIELSHRGAAGVVIVLLAALAVVAWRRRDEAPALVRPAAVAFGLVIGQALLGAVVVWLDLEAASVVLHLGAAMTLLAVLIHITARAFAAEGELRGPVDAGIAKRASVAAAGALVLLLVGSYVTGRNAGYVFPDWPLMNGRVIPDLGNELYAIHFMHRALAAVVGVVILVACLPILRRKAEMPLQARLAHVALGAFAVETAVGAANVWSRLNAAFVTVHLSLAAVIWGSLVAIAIVSRAPAPSTSRAARARGQRSFEAEATP